MPLTDSVEALAQYVEQLLETNKDTLGLQDVWYRDQVKLPRTPAATVEPGEKRRELRGASRYTFLELDVYIMVYQQKIQDLQLNTASAGNIGEAVETLLHSSSTCGGLVIHSMVTQVEPGYATRSGSLMYATRLKFTGTSREILPNTP